MIKLYQGKPFHKIFEQLKLDLLSAPIISSGEWQSQDVSHKPDFSTPELQNVSMSIPIMLEPEELATLTGARLPWAEDHFQERVGGEPLNPSPSEAWWPFRQNKDGNTNAAHKSEGEAFSHTYPERMWPKYPLTDDFWRGKSANNIEPMHGIRFAYGDLADVVHQLARSQQTRQAFLPIWFPEDTGAVHRKRVPCTLGYHFMIRDNRLHMNYYMRSCDALRHFQDDVYMAGRLMQWVCHELNTQAHEGVEPLEFSITPGDLNMHMASFHCFAGDLPIIRYQMGMNLNG